MKREELNQRLSKISTVWTWLRQAHDGRTEAGTEAQQLLLERYGGAVYRYLLRAVGDPDTAEELKQEFALCLVRGGFRKADPERGRFRDYVKTVLFHLVSKHRKQRKKQPQMLPADAEAALAGAAPAPDDDRQFIRYWRDELLARTWAALNDAQPAFFAVLHFRAAHPDLASADMVEELGRQLGKSFTPEGIRQTLRRARQLFAELLLHEVAHSISDPTSEQVERELDELSLLEYCRPLLGRDGRKGT